MADNEPNLTAVIAPRSDLAVAALAERTLAAILALEPHPVGNPFWVASTGQRAQLWSDGFIAGTQNCPGSPRGFHRDFDPQATEYLSDEFGSPLADESSPHWISDEQRLLERVWTLRQEKSEALMSLAGLLSSPGIGNGEVPIDSVLAMNTRGEPLGEPFWIADLGMRVHLWTDGIFETVQPGGSRGYAPAFQPREALYLADEVITTFGPKARLRPFGHYWNPSEAIQLARDLRAIGSAGVMTLDELLAHPRYGAGRLSAEQVLGGYGITDHQ